MSICLMSISHYGLLLMGSRTCPYSVKTLTVTEPRWSTLWVSYYNIVYEDNKHIKLRKYHFEYRKKNIEVN